MIPNAFWLANHCACHYLPLLFSCHLYFWMKLIDWLTFRKEILIGISEESIGFSSILWISSIKKEEKKKRFHIHVCLLHIHSNCLDEKLMSGEVVQSVVLLHISIFIHKYCRDMKCRYMKQWASVSDQDVNSCLVEWQICIQILDSDVTQFLFCFADLYMKFYWSINTRSRCIFVAEYLISDTSKV